MVQFNAEKTRCATDEPAFGIACYIGTVQGDNFEGRHAGCCETWEDAETWLSGKKPPSFIMVYPREGL